VWWLLLDTSKVNCFDQAEDRRQHSRWGVRCIVYAGGAPGHMDCCGTFLPCFTIVPCVDSLLCYRLIRRPKSILQDSPKIYGMCMHLYNCIWVVRLVSRLNLAFLSLKLSCDIDIVLVYLYPCGFDNPGNTLRWKLLQLAYVHLRIILFGLRTANKDGDYYEDDARVMGVRHWVSEELDHVRWREHIN
jgi:hypothetical protein